MTDTQTTGKNIYTTTPIGTAVFGTGITSSTRITSPYDKIDELEKRVKKLEELLESLRKLIIRELVEKI